MAVLPKVSEEAKKTLKGIVIVIVLMGLAFAAGRYLAPDTEKYMEHELVIQKSSEKAKFQITVFKSSDTVKDWHRAKTKVTKPDGTVIEHEDEGTHEQETKIEYRDRVEEKIVEKEVLKDRLVEKLVERNRPQWKVTALMGIPIPVKHGNAWTVNFGADVERRVIGPVFAGIWGQLGSNPQVGVSAGVEF